MRVFPLFDSMVTDGPTDGWMDSWTDGRTDGRVDKASYRVACPQLKKAQALGDFQYDKVKLTSKSKVKTAYDPRYGLNLGILATLDAYS